MAILNFEVPKELADKVYQLVEKAHSGGKIRKGANETTKSVERGEAKLTIFAEDVNPPEVVAHLPLISKEKSIPCISVSSKAELGAAAGLPVGTAAVAIVDAGDSKKLLQDITKTIEVLTKGKEPEKEEPKQETPEEEKTEEKPKKAAKKPKEDKPEEAKE